MVLCMPLQAAIFQAPPENMACLLVYGNFVAVETSACLSKLTLLQCSADRWTERRTSPPRIGEDWDVEGSQEETSP